MEDGLACSLANVEHGAIAIFNAALAGNVRSSQMASANCIGILARSFCQPANGFFGNDQHMRRRLRIDVVKCKRVLVFICFCCELLLSLLPSQSCRILAAGYGPVASLVHRKYV